MSFEQMTGSNLTACQQMVMNAFDDELKRMTREDIAAATNLKLSSVCGRVRELLDLKKLVDRGERRDIHTGKMQQLVGLPAAR
jgi:hypothetical protein